MSDDFVSAVLKWNKDKEKFIKNNLSGSKSGLAPRKTILLTVTEEHEQAIKEFAKQKRKESDASYVGISENEKKKLSIEFEENNLPPRRENFS